MTDHPAIDEQALAETIAADPVMRQIQSDRENWKHKQVEKSEEWTEKIQVLRGQLAPLRAAVRRAESAVRAKCVEIERAKRTRRRNYKQLHTIDRRENARLRFLKTRALEVAVAEVRRQLAKEHKLSSFI